MGSRGGRVGLGGILVTVLVVALLLAVGSGPAAAKAPLVISLDTDVNTIEPGLLRSIAAYTVTQGLNKPLLREPLKRDEARGMLLGADTFQPALAESFTIKDGVATFVLRRDLRFGDGQPITARDVVFTFRRAIEGPGYLRTQAAYFNLTAASQLAIVDDRTVTMRADVTSPLYARIMSFQVFGILSEKTAAKHAASDDPWAVKWFSTNANPSGAYLIKEYDPKRQVVLVPNPNYFEAAQVRNAGVTIRSITDASQRALLVQSGELDLATGIPPRLLKRLQTETAVRVYTAPSSRLMYLGMNNTKPPFDKRAVRQAISHAVPYDALIERVMLGFATPADNLISKNMRTHAAVGSYKTDLDRARALLKEAGVGPFTVQLAVRQSRAQEREAAVFIQDNLRKVGVNVDLLTLPDGEFFSRLNKKELPFFIHDWYQWGEDPYQLMSFLVKSGQFTNYTQYKNTQIDKIIQDGLGEPDAARRAELSKQAQRILFEDAPMGYLYSPHWTALTRPSVKGVNKDQSEILRLEEIYKE